MFTTQVLDKFFGVEMEKRLVRERCHRDGGTGHCHLKSPSQDQVTLRGQDTAVEIPGHEGGEEAAPAPQRWRQTAPGGRGGRTPTSRLPSEASTPTGPGEGGREHPRVHARPSACGSLLRRPTWTSADCVSPRTGAPGEARPAAVPTCRARGGGPG